MHSSRFIVLFKCLGKNSKFYYFGASVEKLNDLQSLGYVRFCLYAVPV